MRVVITGGSGLVGRALADELISAGHNCTVLSRNPARVDFLPKGVEVAAWDAVSASSLRPILESSEAVVHLLGEGIGNGRWSRARKERIRRSRIDSTRALADAVATVGEGLEVVVQASAVGFYGPRGDEEVTEKAPPGIDFLALTCRDWELAGEPIEKAGVRRAVIRTGLVLSRDGGVLPRMMLPFKLFAGGPAGHGGQWVPWIHLSDEVGAIRYLLEHPGAAGVFNLTAPQPVTNREFSRLLGAVLRRPSSLPAPTPALRLVLGEMAMLILTGQRAVPNRLQGLGYEFQFREADAALRDLLG